MLQLYPRKVSRHRIRYLMIWSGCWAEESGLISKEASVGILELLNQLEK